MPCIVHRSDPRVQKHLVRVYATLAAALLTAAVGVAADVTFHIGGLITTLAAFGSLLWLSFSNPDVDSQVWTASITAPLQLFRVSVSDILHTGRS